MRGAKRWRPSAVRMGSSPSLPPKSIKINCLELFSDVSTSPSFLLGHRSQDLPDHSRERGPTFNFNMVLSLFENFVFLTSPGFCVIQKSQFILIWKYFEKRDQKMEFHSLTKKADF